MEMPHPSYKDVTCQFLASLQVNHHNEEGPDNIAAGFGSIEFKIGKDQYKVTFREISDVFGFPVEGRRCLRKLAYYGNDLQQLWWALAAGSYEAGVSKAAAIRSPVLRMVHKILAHTFLGKKEYCTVYDAELMMTGEGLKPLMPSFKSGQIFCGGSRKPTMAALLVKNFMAIKKWAHNNRMKEPSMRIGGLITPILKHIGVELSGDKIGYRLMDAYHLKKINYLHGTVGDFYAYNFTLEDKITARVLLPNPVLTSLAERKNIAFYITKDQYYNPEIHPPVQLIRKPNAAKKPRVNTPAEEPNHVVIPSLNCQDQSMGAAGIVLILMMAP
ncbi:uncharacterized protein LOC112086610 [Eutrema salsugineum]|uniref:uncharacterized protein LOC112086610 n=1 Tax=Eutrema salsugineum TaxID=72664 RepID=UPI000CED70DA|nr:uncharacterized protein LOC112086610 [Eutrema salsugineum]